MKNWIDKELNEMANIIIKKFGHEAKETISLLTILENMEIYTDYFIIQPHIAKDIIENMKKNIQTYIEKVNRFNE